MDPDRKFRALSLDLGQTVWWDTPLDALRHDEARARVLSTTLVGANDRRFEPPEIADADREFREGLDGERRGYGTVSTRRRVLGIAERLQARFAAPLDEVLTRFGSAGLDSHPPTINPEARRLVQSMNHDRIPVVAISNTQRTGHAWGAFLRSEGMALAFVITSSDLEVGKPDPRLFLAAGERLRVPLTDILHVGDRWATDVVGALSVGMGAALYRGLWPRYWNSEDGSPTDPGGEPEVYRWDHLGRARDHFPSRGSARG